MLGGLRVIAKAIGATLDTSRAFAAARGAYLEGRALSEIVAAFAAETENEIDDQVAAELTDAVAQVVEVSRVVAVQAVRLATRLDVLAPRAIVRFRRAVDTLEAQAPAFLEGARSLADNSERATAASKIAAQSVAVWADRAATWLEDLEARGR